MGLTPKRTYQGRLPVQHFQYRKQNLFNLPGVTDFYRTGYTIYRNRVLVAKTPRRCFAATSVVSTRHEKIGLSRRQVIVRGSLKTTRAIVAGMPSKNL